MLIPGLLNILVNISLGRVKDSLDLPGTHNVHPKTHRRKCLKWSLHYYYDDMNTFFPYVSSDFLSICVLYRVYLLPILLHCISNCVKICNFFMVVIAKYLFVGSYYFLCPLIVLCEVTLKGCYYYYLFHSFFVHSLVRKTIDIFTSFDKTIVIDRES